MSQSKVRSNPKSGPSGSAGGWLRAKSSSQYSELLLATLHVAATHFGLAGCIGARIGQGVSVLEGIVECDHTFIWWWHIGRPKECWYYQPTGTGRVKLTELFGNDQWSTCAFVQFIMATDEDVDKIRAAEPGVPNIGGADGPDRPPPRPPAADAEMPVPDTPMQTPRESWTDRDVPHGI